jgi:hypothetical protein
MTRWVLSFDVVPVVDTGSAGAGTDDDFNGQAQDDHHYGHGAGRLRLA